MSVKAYSLLLGLAAVLSAQAQIQTPSNGAPPPKSGSLDGVVTDSQTHGPIRKATVSMTSGLGFSRLGQTDDSGKFQIPNVESGTYHVEYIRAPGYIYQPSGRKTQIVVAEDQAVTGIA